MQQSPMRPAKPKIFIYWPFTEKEFADFYYT